MIPWLVPVPIVALPASQLWKLTISHELSGGALAVSLVIARVSVPECFTDHTLAHQELVLHLEVDVPYYHMLVAAC